LRREIRKNPVRNAARQLIDLPGADDDIATPEQVLDAANYIGTAKDRIVQETVPGGHIGLFVGADTLREHWPRIAWWIAAQ
jgi:hypothetical protein